MTKKIIMGILLFCTCVLTMFSENFSTTITERHAEAGCTGHVMQGESLKVCDPFEGGAGLSGVKQTISAIKSGIRRQNDRLLSFVCKNSINLFCPLGIFQKTIPELGFVIISYFFIQLLIVYRSDGKKRNSFVFLAI